MRLDISAALCYELPIGFIILIVMIILRCVHFSRLMQKFKEHYSTFMLSYESAPSK